MRRWCSLALLLAVPPGSLCAAGHAVGGQDRARMRAPAGVVVDPYENAGYRLGFEGGQIVVTVDLSPLGSSVSFSPGRKPRAGGSVENLAWSLTAGESTRYGAVSKILGWVARNVRYELDRAQPQTAEDVLARRSAYCTGFARASVALLRAVEIPAREVGGYVVSDPLGAWGVAADASTPAPFSGFHRWIEVYFDDVGWVFSDPRSSHHFVPATYLPVASPLIDTAAHRDAELLGRDRDFEAVDTYLDAPNRVLARRNGHERRAAAVAVLLLSGSGAGGSSGAPREAWGEAALRGGGLTRQSQLRGGRTSFVGLDSGSYCLEIKLRDGTMLARPFDLLAAVWERLEIGPQEVGRCPAQRRR
jgi:hypothetical protein